jgi:nucleoside-diphosphate-sugar epimerase
MRILITGHHGYVGSVTAPVLAAAGHDVVGLDTFFYDGCDLGEPGEAGPPARRLDVRDLEPQHVEDFDAVVHLAALSNDPLGDLDPDLTREINLEATIALARAAREAGVRRFVFASSCSMYGASGQEDVLDETAPLAPLTAYAESKVRSEEALSRLADDSFSPVFMRNATIYGVSPRLRADLVLNNLAAWAHTTGAIRILSDGTPWRPLVHVADVAAATAALLEAPSELVHDQAFNVGNEGENYRVRELAEIVQEAAPGCSIELAGTGDPDPRSYRVSFARFARTFPDFEFRWNARRGASELLAAYREAGLTQEEFEGDRYVRLRRLQRLLESGMLDTELRWRGS